VIVLIRKGSCFIKHSALNIFIKIVGKRKNDDSYRTKILTSDGVAAGPDYSREELIDSDKFFRVRNKRSAVIKLKKTLLRKLREIESF
jgi:hypothetical protein